MAEGCYKKRYGDCQHYLFDDRGGNMWGRKREEQEEEERKELRPK